MQTKKGQAAARRETKRRKKPPIKQADIGGGECIPEWAEYMSYDELEELRRDALRWRRHQNRRKYHHHAGLEAVAGKPAADDAVDAGFGVVGGSERKGVRA